MLLKVFIGLTCHTLNAPHKALIYWTKNYYCFVRVAANYLRTFRLLSVFHFLRVYFFAVGCLFLSGAALCAVCYCC